MRQKINRVLQSEGLRQSAMMAVGSVGATGFSAISLIILSRFLGPESFGGFSVAFSLSQLIASVGDLGLNLSLQRYVAGHLISDETKAHAAIQLVGKLKLVIMVAVILAGWLAGPVLAKSVFHVSDAALISLGISLGAVLVLAGYIITIVQAASQFTLAVILNASQAITKLILATGAYFLMVPDPKLAYIGYGLAPLTITFLGIKPIWKYLKSKTDHLNVTQEITRVARFGALSVIAIAVSDQIDVLMVNASLSQTETGLYAAAARIALMATVFAMSFGVVFNTRVAKYKNTHDLSKFVSKASIFSLASLVCIPIGLLLAKPLLLITAGEQYLTAMTTLNYLIIGSVATMATIPFIAVFYAVDYPAYFAVSGVLQALVLIGGNALLIPIAGIEGAGIAKLITRVVVALYTIVTAYDYARRQFNVRPLKDIQGIFIHHE